MKQELLDLYNAILNVDSTSGKESTLSKLLYERLQAPHKELLEVGDGSYNLLLQWGESPKVLFCTHVDTVPPYIAPVFSEDGKVYGRGTCDAKGQIIALYGACKELEYQGKSDFALLLTSGEETGSNGAKAFKGKLSAPLLVIGEPTSNYPVSATKGTQSYDLRFIGKPVHSGYPESGRSAIDMWMDFMMELEIESDFPRDKVLGETTWNVGLLKSGNPQNVLSPELTCRLYFRTTFASHEKVKEWISKKASKILEITPRGGDAPLNYFVPEGFKGKPAAFGSDAPHLQGFEKKIICGPGSILVAHTQDEFVQITDIEQAITNNIRFYECCNKLL